MKLISTLAASVAILSLPAGLAHAQTADDQLSVEIEVEGLAPDTAEHVGLCLSQIVGVRQIF